MIQTILVGYDESEASRRAFVHALELGRRFQARLLVVTVVRVPEPAIFTEVEGTIDTAREHFRDAFRELTDQAEAAGLTIETELVVGHPAEQLIHLAEMHHVDLIVVGSRGASRMKRWMLGSVSERVLRYAHCPVTIVR
jgi:nucleotide-binding universal stress UspA family protein